MQPTVFDLFRDTEIRYFDSTSVINENIGTLDVTMDNPLFMKVVKAHQHLSDPEFDEGFFKGAVVFQERGDGASGNVLQENVQVLVVDGGVFQQRS